MIFLEDDEDVSTAWREFIVAGVVAVAVTVLGACVRSDRVAPVIKATDTGCVMLEALRIDSRIDDVCKPVKEIRKLVELYESGQLAFAPPPSASAGPSASAPSSSAPPPPPPPPAELPKLRRSSAEVPR